MAAQYEWQSITLCTIDTISVEKIYAWQNNVRVRDSMKGFRFPMQRSTAAKWLASLAETNAQSKVAYAIYFQNEAVGVINLHTLNHFQRKAKLTIYIGEERYQNKGIGFVSCALMLDYAFNGLDLRKVSLEVVAKNSPAIALYEKLGFEKEGTLRNDYYLDGREHDVHVYGMLKDEFDLELPDQANRLVSSIFSN